MKRIKTPPEIEVGYKGLREFIREQFGDATLDGYENSLKDAQLKAARKEVREFVEWVKPRLLFTNETEEDIYKAKVKELLDE